MANQITIYDVINITPPFSGTACDVYGNNCSYIGSGTTFPITFNLPSQFDTAPALQITITDSIGCSLSEIAYCTNEGFRKQFQNLNYFFFMDSTQYHFQ